MKKMSESTRGNILIVLAVLSILNAIFGHIMRKNEMEQAFGIKYFFDDIREAETIIVYDHLHNEVARYSNNDIDDLFSKYSISRPGIRFPKNTLKYWREFKKHVGELQYTIEVIFPKDRNDNKADRDIIKGDTIEILTIHTLDTESFKGDYNYEEYANHMNGQVYVVFLRKTLLGRFFGRTS